MRHPPRAGLERTVVDTEPQLYLVVDDDRVFRERLARALRQRGHDVRVADDVPTAMALARQETPERAIVDMKMPGGSGLELVRDLRALDPSTAIVVLTGYGSIANAIDAIRLGATHYLQKPADVNDILAAFERGEPTTELAPAETPSTVQAPTLARAEWEHMQRVLSDTAGNISEAARRLGMHRRSLQRKLQKVPPRQ